MQSFTSGSFSLLQAGSTGLALLRMAVVAISFPALLSPMIASADECRNPAIAVGRNARVVDPSGRCGNPCDDHGPGTVARPWCTVSRAFETRLGVAREGAQPSKEGRIGGSYRFDGTGYLSVHRNLGAQHSFVFWAKTDDDRTQGVFGGSTFGDFEHVVMAPSASAICYRDEFPSVSTCIWNSTMFVNDREWHHYAIVIDRKSFKAYQDGKLLGETSFEREVSGITLSQIGRAACNGCGLPGEVAHFRGQLDDIGAFDRALSPKEIKMVADAGKLGAPLSVLMPMNGPVGYWNLDQPVASKLDWDMLLLRGGVYRPEQPNGYFVPIHGYDLRGTPSRRIVIRSFPGERAEFRLSDPVTKGWQPCGAGCSSSGVWVYDWLGHLRAQRPWHADHLGKANPQLVAVLDPASAGSRPTLLRQVNPQKSSGFATWQLEATDSTSQSDMKPGDFYFESDTSHPNYGKLFVRLKDGASPNGQQIEVGLHTTWYLPDAQRVDIEHVDVHYSGAAGMSAGLYLSGKRIRLADSDVSYHPFMDLGGRCELCEIRQSTFSHSGNSGSNLLGDGTAYIANRFDENNLRRFNLGWHCGGMKLIPGASNMIIRGNTFSNSRACPGLWFDGMGGGHRIEKNRFYDNENFGLMIEVTRSGMVSGEGAPANPIHVEDNLFFDSVPNTFPWHGGIYVSASDDVKIKNNLFYRVAGGVVMEGMAGITPDGQYDVNRTRLRNNRAVDNLFIQVTLPMSIASRGTSEFKLYDDPRYDIRGNVSDRNIYMGGGGADMWAFFWPDYPISTPVPIHWCPSYCTYYRTTDLGFWQRTWGYDTNSQVIYEAATNRMQLQKALNALRSQTPAASVIRDIRGAMAPALKRR